MGFFKKEAPTPTRDAAAQWRINRTRRQSFTPAYFAKQAFLFISLTILVFFVDIALYIVFQFAIYNNHDYDESPTSTTFEVTDNLSATEDESGATVYKLPDRPPRGSTSKMPGRCSWEMTGKSSGATMRPRKSRITPTLKTTSQMPHARSTSKTTRHSSGRTVTMAPLS